MNKVDAPLFDFKHHLLLSTVVVIFIIVLYGFLWFLWRRSRQIISSNGLDKATIDALPITVLQRQQADSNEELGECSICLDSFEVGDVVKTMPLCHHSYHRHCVDKWLNSHSDCPLCRTSLVRINHDDSLA
ncbi:hypothetical protein ACFE04_022066 [Oxalis oulophora]